MGVTTGDALSSHVTNTVPKASLLRDRNRKTRQIKYASLKPRTGSFEAVKRPLKRPDRVYPLGKNQEYACHDDWGKIDRVEIITSVQRRRRWSAEEKARIVQETWRRGCRCR
jgi:hypothetical protein